MSSALKKILSPREQSFINNFFDKGNKETYGKYRPSALKAGYSAATSAGASVWVKKSKKLSEEIARRIAEGEKKESLVRSKAIDEARSEYLNAKSEKMKQFWYKMWVDLNGWLVQKIETKTDDGQVKEEVQRAVADEIRLMLKNEDKLEVIDVLSLPTRESVGLPS